MQLNRIETLFNSKYLLLLAYEFWSVQPLPNTMYFRYLDYWFGMVQYYFLRFSECLNPLFYNLGSTKMRKYTIDFVRRKILRRPKEKQQFVSSTESSGRRLSRQMSYPISWKRLFSSKRVQNCWRYQNFWSKNTKIFAQSYGCKSKIPFFGEPVAIFWLNATSWCNLMGLEARHRASILL